LRWKLAAAALREESELGYFSDNLAVVKVLVIVKLCSLALNDGIHEDRAV
jgi:hypothetical protein